MNDTKGMVFVPKSRRSVIDELKGPMRATTGTTGASSAVEETRDGSGKGVLSGSERKRLGEENGKDEHDSRLNRAKEIVAAIRRFREKNKRADINLPSMESSASSSRNSHTAAAAASVGALQSTKNDRNHITDSLEWYTECSKILGNAMISRHLRPLTVGVFMDEPGGSSKVKEIADAVGECLKVPPLGWLVATLVR